MLSRVKCKQVKGETEKEDEKAELKRKAEVAISMSEKWRVPIPRSPTSFWKPMLVHLKPSCTLLPVQGFCQISIFLQRTAPFLC